MKKLTVESAKYEASKKNGKCLSKVYKNSSDNLIWQCEQKHIWTSSLSNIKAGKWCSRCASPGKYRTLADMQKIAIQRGGKCLSDEYKNGHTKLHWICKFEHEWLATPNDIFSGRWGKNCSVGFMERVCREYFQQIFNRPFPNVRPEWFINPNTGKKLELDGYSKELNIAFEYQGQHHTRFNSLFHKNENDLKHRKKLDLIKRKILDKMGVRIIYIPQIPTFIKLENLMSFLKIEFDKQKIKYPNDILTLKINLKKAYAPEESKYNSLLNEFFKIKKGKFLSPSYLGLHVKVDFQCEKLHIWSATPAKVLLGNRWCPICAKNNKKIV